MSSSAWSTERVTQLGVDAPDVRPTTVNRARASTSRSSAVSTWKVSLPVERASSARRVVLALWRPPTTTMASTLAASSSTSAWRSWVALQMLWTTSTSG